MAGRFGVDVWRMARKKCANEHRAGDEYATNDAGAHNVDKGSDLLMIFAAINDDTHRSLRCR
ncbi:MAG: hypothetical protein ACLP19_20720 [Xanthobacteraceae bacterium]